MKNKIQTWVFRLAATGFLIAGILVTILLNPILTYGNRTQHRNFNIFHTKPLAPTIKPRLDSATELLKTSEFYSPDFDFDVCLNDGSLYPKIIQQLRGDAFAWGFYNKIVLNGHSYGQGNYTELNGYLWNMTELLVNEAVHCLQYHQLGIWKSNPLAQIPEWKWEGYPEYIARQGPDHHDLTQNIDRLLAGQKADTNGWAVSFPDGTMAPRAYYDYWLLVQYCLDIKGMNYMELLEDPKGQAQIKEEMLRWYSAQKLGP